MENETEERPRIAKVKLRSANDIERTAAANENVVQAIREVASKSEAIALEIRRMVNDRYESVTEERLRIAKESLRIAEERLEKAEESHSRAKRSLLIAKLSFAIAASILLITIFKTSLQLYL